MCFCLYQFRLQSVCINATQNLSCDFSDRNIFNLRLVNSPLPVGLPPLCPPPLPLAPPPSEECTKVETFVRTTRPKLKYFFPDYF